MKRAMLSIVPLAAVALATPVIAGNHGAGHHEAGHDHHGASAPQSLRADVIDRAGAVIGTVVLTETPNGVLVDADIGGLPEGELGFHFHEKGLCEGSGGFASAGGHFAPRGHDHGFKVASGAHAGDMPNQFVGKDGRLRAHVLNPAVTLHHGETALMDADGSSLMVHENADDYESQPAGNAGNRFACAVIAPPRAQ